MNRRKGAALALVVIILASTALGFMYLSTPPPEDIVEQEPPIVLHPYNKLNWWDIAWDIADSAVFTGTYERIAGLTSRMYGSSGYENAAYYLMVRMNSIGLPVSYWGNRESVVAYQEGYGSDNRSIVFGAHLDSPPSSSRGADQNAAGCAVVLMIAATLAQFRLPIDIYYCWFAGGLEVLDPMLPNERLFTGANEVCDILEDNEVDVIAYYNFDEILYQDPNEPDEGRLHVEHKNPSGSNYYSTKYLADVLISFMRENGPGEIIVPVFATGTRSDHEIFWERGFPAVNIRSAYYADFGEILPPDTIAHPDYNTTQAKYLARAACATAIYLGSKGNGNNTSYRLDRIVNPESSESIHTVLTVPQTVTIHGEVRVGTSLSLAIYNDTDDLYSQAITGNFSFTYDFDERGTYEFRVINSHNSSADINLYLEYVSDTDGDTVLDSDQYTWPDPDPILDWDHDGLSDTDEVIAGTDIFDLDTDNDGVYDGPEVQNGLNPLRRDMHEDPDGDDLTNRQELNLGTNPFSNDTDFDLLPDGWEFEFNTDPLVDDSLLDLDNDSLTNLEEYTYGSDPLSVDGDNDGLLDVEEIALGTDPLSEDTDQDGVDDYLEVKEGLNPLSPDYDFDMISDGSDSNPRINLIIVIISLTMLPVIFGLFFLRKRLTG